MANLAVEVAGVAFKNPIIPASGVFGYGREYEKLFPLSKLGGIATKGHYRSAPSGQPGTSYCRNAQRNAEFGRSAKSGH